MSSLPATQWTLPDHAAGDNDISVLPRIFEDAINIAIFQRPLPADIAFSAQAQCQTNRAWQYSWLGHPDEAFTADLLRHLPAPDAATPLVEDIALPIADWLERAVDHIEKALGTALQTAVKRIDEQAFALANGQNLMFCEDAARRVDKALRQAPGIIGFPLKVVHAESLHAHNAVARSEWSG